MCVLSIGSQQEIDRRLLSLKYMDDGNSQQEKREKKHNNNISLWHNSNKRWIRAKLLRYKTHPKKYKTRPMPHQGSCVLLPNNHFSLSLS